MEESTRTSFEPHTPIEWEPPLRRFRRILDNVSYQTSIPVDEILCAQRGDKDACRARQIAMYLTKQAFGFSYPRVGRMFNRDHTSILLACRKINANPQDYPELEALGLKGN